ncbi:hypothetical protein AURDEDRAFT_113075 [Auricularia subglabra TFB-10046 SS5]|nr:hypothetical protein AURDEDRAFT_113075 [Auricularia subglabra TFB-10046 SS5]
MTSHSPRFPSLYDPRRDGAGTNSTALFGSSDVYRFTLYWSLVLLVPLFMVPALWAFAMVARSLAQSGSRRKSYSVSRKKQSHDAAWNVRVLSLAALVIPAAFGIVALVLAALLSVCTAYIIVGVYDVADFAISTWIPFVWMLLHTLFIILGSYSLVIDVI